MSARRHALNAFLRVLTLLGHLTVLSFALASLAAYGTLSAGFLVVTTIAFTVINSRLLFPWPEPRHEVLRSLRIARLTLWAAFIIGLVSCAAGAFGSYPFNEWWEVFALLTGTSALNLVVLLYMSSAGESTQVGRCNKG
jgi:hypothetical protein